MSNAPRWAITVGMALVVLSASEGKAAGQTPGTTTTPGQTKVGLDYYMVPKGTYTVPAGAASWVVEYDWGLVVMTKTGEQDGAGQGLWSQIPNPAAGTWQGANVGPAGVGTKIWVKSRVRWIVNGMAGGPTDPVRGVITIAQE